MLFNFPHNIFRNLLSLYYSFVNDSFRFCRGRRVGWFGRSCPVNRHLNYSRINNITMLSPQYPFTLPNCISRFIQITSSYKNKCFLLFFETYNSFQIPITNSGDPKCVHGKTKSYQIRFWQHPIMLRNLRNAGIMS